MLAFNRFTYCWELVKFDDKYDNLQEHKGQHSV